MEGRITTPPTTSGVQKRQVCNVLVAGDSISAAMQIAHQSYVITTLRSSVVGAALIGFWAAIAEIPRIIACAHLPPGFFFDKHFHTFFDIIFGGPCRKMAAAAKIDMLSTWLKGKSTCMLAPEHSLHTRCCL
jgi:hypothetical protein